MSGRFSDDDKAFLRLLSRALVEIRAAAHTGDAERARRLADAFHNAPAALAHAGPDAAMADVREACRRHGENHWLERVLSRGFGPDA